MSPEKSIFHSYFSADQFWLEFVTEFLQGLDLAIIVMQMADRMIAGLDRVHINMNPFLG